MATTTTYFGLTKPATTDPVDITQLNANADQTDAALHAMDVKIAGVTNRVQYNYNTTSYPARPSGVAAGLVEWIGPTAPSGAVDGDTWVDVS